MHTWHNTDKSSWPVGPWQAEPDKAQWITAAGLDGLIVRSPLGALCGYVGIPPGHPLYGKDYDVAGNQLGVHGGLTFADACQPTDDPATHVCHVEQFAAHKVVWWLGFDCAHAWDLSPHAHYLMPDSTYRDFDYVQAEVEQLAAQLMEMSS